jgi:hypothetical protein
MEKNAEMIDLAIMSHNARKSSIISPRTTGFVCHRPHFLRFHISSLNIGHLAKTWSLENERGDCDSFEYAFRRRV